MESNTSRRLAGLREKVPDIEKTLAMVRFLQSRGTKTGKSSTSDDDAGSDDGDNREVEPLETTFELNDTLYSHALVGQTEEVYLWLGVRSSFTSFLPAQHIYYHSSQSRLKQGALGAIPLKSSAIGRTKIAQTDV